MSLKLVNTERGGPAALEAAVDALGAALDAQREALGRLGALSDEKLAALRQADPSALNRIAFEEARLLAALRAGDPVREAAVARLAQLVPGALPAGATLTQLAEGLPEPGRSRLLAKAGGLRPAALALREKNEKVARVARGLQGHLHAVVGELASANQETVGYGREGRADQRTTRTWVDAVG